MSFRYCTMIMCRIKEFSEWAQCIVLELVSKYVPVDSNEIFDIMDLLEDRLQHANGAVVLATIKLFLQLTLSMADVHQQVFIIIFLRQVVLFFFVIGSFIHMMFIFGAYKSISSCISPHTEVCIRKSIAFFFLTLPTIFYVKFDLLPCFQLCPLHAGESQSIT